MKFVEGAKSFPEKKRIQRKKQWIGSTRRLPLRPSRLYLSAGVQ